MKPNGMKAASRTAEFCFPFIPTALTRPSERRKSLSEQVHKIFHRLAKPLAIRSPLLGLLNTDALQPSMPGDGVRRLFHRSSTSRLVSTPSQYEGSSYATIRSFAHGCRPSNLIGCDSRQE